MLFSDCKLRLIKCVILCCWLYFACRSHIVGRSQLSVRQSHITPKWRVRLYEQWRGLGHYKSPSQAPFSTMSPQVIRTAFFFSVTYLVSRFSNFSHQQGRKNRSHYKIQFIICFHLKIKHLNPFIRYGNTMNVAQSRSRPFFPEAILPKIHWITNEIILIKLVPPWFCPGSTVVQWLALLPHSERLLGLIPA